MRAEGVRTEQNFFGGRRQDRHFNLAIILKQNHGRRGMLYSAKDQDFASEGCMVAESAPPHNKAYL